MSDLKEKKPRSRAPAHGWTAGADEVNKFFTPVERRGWWAGLFTRVKAKKFVRGKAMAQRRLQLRCETKGRRLKTTPCTWSGSFHDEQGEILGEEASTRPSICVELGYMSFPSSELQFTVFMLVFVSFHFSRVDNARLHLSIPCNVFGRLQVDVMFGYHGRRKKARSVVRIISSNQRNPRNPNPVKSMKSGLIERAHWVTSLSANHCMVGKEWNVANTFVSNTLKGTNVKAQWHHETLLYARQSHALPSDRH